MSNLAIAYGMKRKARGGDMTCSHGSTDCEMCHGGKMMAEGGEIHDDDDEDLDMIERIIEQLTSHVKEEESSGYESMPKEHERMDERAEHEDDKDLNQHGEYEEGADGMDFDDEPQHERMISHDVENQEEGDEEDMVGRIMKQREHSYSEGGRVANDDAEEADFEPNDFDDLVLDDHLDEHYTGANSGDEIGDDQEDEDRHDIVTRIMKMRGMKPGRNPVPA